MSDKHPGTVFGKDVSWSPTPQKVVQWSTRKAGRATALGGEKDRDECVNAESVSSFGSGNLRGVEVRSS